MSGGSFAIKRITPPILARQLEQDCIKALTIIKNINPSDNNSLQQEVADVKVWANLGLHFAEKLKGSVALQTCRTNGGEENDHLRFHWEKLRPDVVKDIEVAKNATVVMNN